MLTLTPREVCNLIYYRIIDGFKPIQDSSSGEITETVEEQIIRFEEDIGMRGSSNEKSAMDLLREDMIARGLDPDGLPVVDLDRAWFKEDDFGESWEDYQNRKRNIIEGGMDPSEEAGIDIEF